ncbi:PCI domain-containing protein [Phakopsora pachyrhizi]|uniref:PCI domain-domain-containing protein n=1 Tax=Phakopsora pachyrhizi TaxID=170000 RepID=A0AAV0BAV7_PHAPC|nr:PCI domain-containing protein [Phakopsora pachyrhizi]CAH7683721.1 PCI domain-domain-containing protein [Phakopsora pachyrhizi]
MAENSNRKQEKDFTAEVDQLIGTLDSSEKGVTIQEKLDRLLVLEKQTRNASDLSSTTRLLVKIVTIVFESNNIDGLCQNVQQLSRKHGQLRQATTTMVEKVMTFLELVSQEDNLKLINSLREVTEGKIYLEVQRARLTKKLAIIKESAGKTAEANDLMQELQVETFGSMDRREKMDFILEQMRLLLTQRDWEKMAIVSKKINNKWLAEAENEDLKLRFYALMITYAAKSSRYLDLCKYYRSIYESESIKSDPVKSLAALRNAVYFVILAPHDNEQSDLLHRIATQEEELKNIEAVHDLVKCFTTSELMRWPGIQELYGPALRKSKVFGPRGSIGLEGDIEEYVDPEVDSGEQRWQELHKRVVEHNIRAVSKYYTRLTMQRLSELLDLSPQESESTLAKLVSSKTVYAKIDRPSGIVQFKPKDQQSNQGENVLNTWNSEVGKLLGLVEKTVHLIHKEFALQGIK